MKDTFVKIIEEFGVEAFSDERRLLSMLSDYAPAMRKERLMVKNVFEVGIHKTFLAAVGASSEEKQSAIRKGRYQIEDKLGLAEHNIDLLVEWFTVCLDMNIPVEKNTPQTPEQAISFQTQEASPTGENELIRDTSWVKITYPSGDTYEGEGLNGHPHGKGIYTFADGSKYEGEFDDLTPTAIELRKEHRRGAYENNVTTERQSMIERLKNATVDLLKEAGANPREVLDAITGNGISDDRLREIVEKMDENEKAARERTAFEEKTLAAIKAHSARDQTEKAPRVCEIGLVRDTSRVKITYPCGDTYEGESLDGRPHGKGIYTFADGSKFEGEFAKGRAGKGIFTYVDGDIVERFTASVVYRFANGDRFEGAWGYSHPEKGVYYFYNGDKYEGELSSFHDGKFHDSKFVFVFADGTKKVCFYKEGYFYLNDVATSFLKEFFGARPKVLAKISPYHSLRLRNSLIPYDKWYEKY